MILDLPPNTEQVIITKTQEKISFTNAILAIPKDNKIAQALLNDDIINDSSNKQGDDHVPA